MVVHRLDHRLENDRFNRLVRQGRAEAAIELAQETYESAVEVKDERLIGMAVLDLGYAFVLAGRGREALLSPRGGTPEILMDVEARRRIQVL